MINAVALAGLNNLWHFVNPLSVLNAQVSGQFFISIRLTTRFGITLEIVLTLFSRIWNIDNCILEPERI